MDSQERLPQPSATFRGSMAWSSAVTRSHILPGEPEGSGITLDGITWYWTQNTIGKTHGKQLSDVFAFLGQLLVNSWIKNGLKLLTNA